MVAITRTNQDDWVYGYVEGGRVGLQKRFGELIQEKIKNISDTDLRLLCEYQGVNYDNLRSIRNGDFSSVDYKIVGALADSLDYTIDEGLGEIRISPENESKLLQMIREDGFVSLGGTTTEGEYKNPQLPSQQLMKLYILHTIVHDF